MKLYLIAIIIIFVLVTGVIICQYYDSKIIRTDFEEKEYREIKSIPDDVDITEIKQLIKETDIIALKVEQHRLELEKILEGRN